MREISTLRCGSSAHWLLCDAYAYIRMGFRRFISNLAFLRIYFRRSDMDSMYGNDYTWQHYYNWCTTWDIYVIFHFLVVILQESKKGKGICFNNIFYLIKCIQMVFQNVINNQKWWDILCSFFHTNSLKSSIYLQLSAHTSIQTGRILGTH